MTVAAQFQDRREAGQLLAEKLQQKIGGSEALVLAFRADGVPVAYEVANALSAPLDVFLVENLVAPGHEENVLGHVASGGVRIFNDDAIKRAGISEARITELAGNSEQELQRRERDFRGDRAAEPIEGHHVILVDDGFTVGASIRPALEALRARRPRSITVAAPVGSPDTATQLEHAADEVICLMTPEGFVSVGAWYADFIQVTDEEARRLLRESITGPAKQENLAAKRS